MVALQDSQSTGSGLVSTDSSVLTVLILGGGLVLVTAIIIGAIALGNALGLPLM